MKAKTLIVGYGNADRQDDGAGWHVLKNLAEKVGYSIPDDPGAMIEVETEYFDLLFILQIVPELSEVFSHYDRVCFVDAHTTAIEEDIVWNNISPSFERSPLTHHMSPQTVLSITASVYNHIPETILVSIRGYSFQFNRELSQKTAILTEKATQRIWEWINSTIPHA